MARPDTLHLFLGDEPVGWVHDAAPLAFEYAPAWLQRQPPRPVAAIPLQPGRQQSDAVQAFFENLLPEGELRDHLSTQRKASTLFSLLLAVAGETAGAFVLLPAGQQPQPAQYEPTTWAELAATILAKSAAAIDLQGGDARISLAGQLNFCSTS